MGMIADSITNNDILGQTYRIVIQGRLNVHWVEWFNEYVEDIVIMDPGSNQTVLTIRVPDQAALRGILSRIWDLNLTLISIVKMCDIEKNYYEKKGEKR